MIKSLERRCGERPARDQITDIAAMGGLKRKEGRTVINGRWRGELIDQAPRA
jgi:hypothetical protein